LREKESSNNNNLAEPLGLELNLASLPLFQQAPDQFLNLDNILIPGNTLTSATNNLMTDAQIALQQNSVVLNESRGPSLGGGALMSAASIDESDDEEPGQRGMHCYIYVYYVLLSCQICFN
jgi:hypothetical protein